MVPRWVRFDMFTVSDYYALYMDNVPNLIKGYETASDIALEKLRQRPAQQVVAASGAVLDSGLLHLEYLAQSYCIDLVEGSVYLKSTSQPAKPALKTLILQYLAASPGRAPTGELIAFRNIPGAAGYEPSFVSRALSQFVKAFDGKPEQLLRSAAALKGRSAHLADVGVELDVFPYLPIVYGLWHSDAELPAEGIILFDSTIKVFRNIELVIVSASNASRELVNAAR